MTAAVAAKVMPVVCPFGGEETWGMAAAAFANAVRAKAASVSSADMKLLAGDAAPEFLPDELKLAGADWSEGRDIILSRSAFSLCVGIGYYFWCTGAGRICVCARSRF